MSKPGGISFTYLEEEGIDTDALGDLMSRVTIEVVAFTNDTIGQVKRSERLITDVQRYSRRDPGELKGIEEGIEVYKID